MLTDESGVGIGATILQHNDNNYLQPIAYASRVLNKAKRNYPQIEIVIIHYIWCYKV